MDVKRSADSLLSTINDILDLSKIESEKMELIPVEYDVSSLLHDVINMISMRRRIKIWRSACPWMKNCHQDCTEMMCASVRFL